MGFSLDLRDEEFPAKIVKNQNILQSVRQVLQKTSFKYVPEYHKTIKNARQRC